MATTLLNAVNEVFRRTGLTDSVDGVLTSLTLDSLQVDIDLAKDAINDTVRELYTVCDLLPWQTKEGSITLATGTREYAAPANYMAMVSRKLVRQNEGQFMLPYEGGYAQMFDDQIDPAQYSGQPNRWAVNPVTDQIRVDNNPTSAENGDVYTFLYTAEIYLSAATDPFPFNDAVYHALAPAITETYRQLSDGDKEYSPSTKQRSISQAIKRLTHNPDQDSY